MKKRFLKYLLSAILFTASQFVLSGQGTVVSEPTPTWWASISSSLTKAYETVDELNEVRKQFFENNEFFEAVYKGLGFLEQTRKVRNVMDRVESTYRKYDSYISSIEALSKSGVASVSDLRPWVNVGTNLITDFLYDTQMLKELLAKGKLTNKDAQKTVEELEQKADEADGQMSVYLQMLELQLKAGLIDQAIGMFNYGKPEANHNNEFIHAFEKVEGLSQDDWNDKVKETMDTLAINNKAFKEVGKTISKANAPAIRFAELVVIIMTILYVPYNLLRVMSGERQSSDALMKTVVGFLIGLLILLFLSTTIAK